MLSPEIVPFVLLAASVVVGVGVLLYLILKNRQVRSNQNEKFVKALSAIEEFQNLQPQLKFFLKRAESDGQVAPNAAVQTTGVTVGALKNSISATLMSPAQQKTIADTNVHSLQRAEILAAVPAVSRPLLHKAPLRELTSVAVADSKPGDYVRLKKDFILEHTDLRFSVLKDWISTNMLAIFRRTSRDWKTTQDLIAIIPSYLEPEAEILKGQLLLVSTRGHAEKLAIPVRKLHPSSEFFEFFDFVSSGPSRVYMPAVLTRSAGDCELVSKGVVMRTELLPDNLPLDVTIDDVVEAALV